MDNHNQEEQTEIEKEIRAKEVRKLRARKKGQRNPLSGFGVFGLVGWSVVVPTLLGAAIGNWLDYKYSDSVSWTLNLLIIGLVIGCFNAWFWIQKENKEIRKDLEDNDE